MYANIHTYTNKLDICIYITYIIYIKYILYMIIYVQNIGAAPDINKKGHF